MDNDSINTDDFSELPDELLDSLNTKKHQRETLVEDCYVLSLSDLGKGLLWNWNNDKGETLPVAYL